MYGRGVYQLQRTLFNCNKLNIYNNRYLNIIKRNTGSYEGDGKTTVKILNKESDSGLMIDSFSQLGFRLNNGMTVIGPMVIFPRSVLSWNIEGTAAITEDSLRLFTILEPKVDILVLGIGSDTVNRHFSKYILEFMRKYNINVEIIPTEEACSTFNFLNSEGRNVGGAFIPPLFIKVTPDDMMRSKLQYQKLYEIED